MKTKIVALIALSFVAGCNTVPPAVDKPFPSTPAPAQTQFTPHTMTAADRQAVERGLRSSLKDPDSARFGTMSASKSDSGVITVCGYVNARNSYGGYTGEQPFIGAIFGEGDKRSFAVIDIASTPIKISATRTVCSQNGISF